MGGNPAPSITWTGTWRSDRDRPFFLFASFPKPHSAFDPPRPFDARYDPRQMPDPTGSVELLAERGLTALASRPAEYEWDKLSPEGEADDQGALLRAGHLPGPAGGAAAGLPGAAAAWREDTLVVFTADHGEMLGDFGHYFKETFYEGSARVPLIASQPGTLPEGRREEGLARAARPDPGPCWAAAGAPLPAGIDGLDPVGDAARRRAGA